MKTKDFERAGHILFGKRWQTEMARALVSKNGRSYGSSTIRKWMSLKAPIPAHIEGQVKLLCEQKIEDLKKFSENLHAPK